MWLLVAIVFLPLAEIYVVLGLSAPLLGWPLTVLSLAATSALGAWLLRREGRQIWRDVGVALQLGQLPYASFVDAILVAFGAALMLTPGFISDIMGLVLLVPVTRRPFRRLVIRAIERRALRSIMRARVS